MKSYILTFLLSLWVVGASAQPQLEKLKMQANQGPDDTNKVIAYGKLGSAYRYDYPDSANYYADKALKLARQLNYKTGIARVYAFMGSLQDMHGQLDEGRTYIQKALTVYKELGNKNGMAQCYNSLGVNEGQRGNLSLAISNFYDALKLYKSEGNAQGEMETYFKLGTANELSKSFDVALSYYAQAKVIADTLPPSNIAVSLRNNMGNLYAKKGDLKKALEYFEEGIALSKQTEFGSVNIALSTNAGNAYSRLGNKNKALIYHTQSLNDARKYGLPEEEAHALVNLASSLDSTENVKALGYLINAMEITKRIKNGGMLSDVYHAISEVYASSKMYKEAYESAAAYHKLSDSMINIERAREIAKLQSNFELEESKGKINALQIINQKHTFQRNLGIIALGCIGIIIIILWLSYSKVRLLNKELEASNQVKDKLFSVIGHDLRSPIGGLVQTLELLEEESVFPNEYKEVVSDLKHRGEAAQDILNSMLLWGKAQLQGVKVRTVKFDPLPHLNNTITALNKQATDKSISIVNNIDAKIELTADADHFDFIIRNLLSNAIKFSFEGGRIAINAIEKNNEVIFSVKDSGVGISEKEQFEFLHATPQVTFGTKGEKGTGLGLLLIKEFVAANNGRIWLESTPGSGSTFYFALKGIAIIPQQSVETSNSLNVKAT